MAEWIQCNEKCGTWITFKTKDGKRLPFEINGKQHFCRNKSKGKWPSGPKWLSGLSLELMVVAIIIIVVALWISGR